MHNTGEMIIITINLGHIRHVTPTEVKEEQLGSINNAYIRLSQYVSSGYEILSQSGDTYTLAPPKPKRKELVEK